MVELLVVLGILAILAAILLPTIAAMQKTAKATATQQRITALAAAIGQYQSDYRSYPGPLSDESLLGRSGAPAMPQNLGVARRATSAENLVLGLVGGLRQTAAGWAYDPERVGQGPWNASAASSPPKTYFTPTLAKPMLSAGLFADESGQAAMDTAIPEFLDTLDDPLPILYLRARPGAPGIMSNLSVAPTASESKFYQYDYGQVAPYVSVPIGLKPGKSHGLDYPSAAGAAIAGRTAAGPNNALQYLRESMVSPDPEPAAGETDATRPDRFNKTGTPRQKNTFILISAGKDRCYGTHDDITSFGAVTK